MADIENKGHTPNIGLIKPNADNFYSVKDANDNSDILDEIITKIYSCLGISDPSSITSVDSRIDNKIKTAIRELIGVDGNLLNNLSTLNDIVSYFTDEDEELLEKINTASNGITTFKTSFFKWFGAESFPINSTYASDIQTIRTLITAINNKNDDQNSDIGLLFDLIGVNNSEELKVSLNSIGEVTSLINALTTLKRTIGVLSDLSSISTTNRTSLVKALKEVIGWIGTLSSLKTTNKNSLVLAINSLVSDISGVSTRASTNKDSIDKIISLIGDTTELSNGVGYGDYIFGNDIVNILLDIIGCMGDPGYIPYNTITESLDTHDIEIGDIRSDVGFADDLRTENKDNLVSAINEVRKELYPSNPVILEGSNLILLAQTQGTTTLIIPRYTGTLKYGDKTIHINPNTSVTVTGPYNLQDFNIILTMETNSTGEISSAYLRIVKYDTDAKYYHDYSYNDMINLFNGNSTPNHTFTFNMLIGESGYTINNITIWNDDSEINKINDKINKSGKNNVCVIGTSHMPSSTYSDGYTSDTVDIFLDGSISDNSKKLSSQMTGTNKHIHLKAGIYSLQDTVIANNKYLINDNHIVISGSPNSILSFSNCVLGFGRYTFKNMTIIMGINDININIISDIGSSNHPSKFADLNSNLSKNFLGIQSSTVTFEDCRIYVSLTNITDGTDCINKGSNSQLKFNNCKIKFIPYLNENICQCVALVNNNSSERDVIFDNCNITVASSGGRPDTCYCSDIYILRDGYAQFDKCQFTLTGGTYIVSDNTDIKVNVHITKYGTASIINSHITLSDRTSISNYYIPSFKPGEFINNIVEFDGSSYNYELSLDGFNIVNNNKFNCEPVTRIRFGSRDNSIIITNNIIKNNSIDSPLNINASLCESIIIKNNILSKSLNIVGSSKTIISDNIVLKEE